MKQSFVVMFLLFTSLCYSQVIINEVQSSNSSTIADNYGEFDDWIEIYNPNDFQVDIGGLVLKDNVDIWQIPEGDINTILPSDGYFLLWADDEEYQGLFHTNFKLSAANGEFLGLFEKDSVTEIESVNIPPLMENQSYGKCWDGNWTTISNPTPLTINDCQVSSTQKIINNKLLIYPSISNGYIHIDFQEDPSGIISLHLFSINGKLVLDKNYNGNSFRVDLNKLIPDIYILKIFTEKESYTRKLVLIE